MKPVKWDDVEKEDLNDMLSRRCIHGDRMTLAMIYLKKGCVVPTHSHDNEQMSTVFKGALKFLIDGKEIVVGPGETLRIPPFVPHSAEALEDCEEMDAFAPVRQDWVDGTDLYLRGPRKS
jgi:quercetin dioxygenase-like cupin family protein